MGGAMASTLKRFLIGRPLATDEADHQRISKTIGLAVFSSDAISSTAYATQEILLVLVPIGGMAVLAQSDYTFGFLTPPSRTTWTSSTSGGSTTTSRS